MSTENPAAATPSDASPTLNRDERGQNSPKAGADRRWWRRGWARDLAALSAFALLGGYLTLHLWRDPYALHVAGNRQDSVQLQWLLQHAARLFTHGESPLFTHLVNSPYGVNLMANTSILAMALPLAPVTIVFGPAVSAAILLTLVPAATAAAWYHVLSRHIVASRGAAFLGGLFAGFAPAMVSHDTGHPNIVAQFLLPYLVLAVLRMRVPGRSVRTGLELAGLVVLQIFINEEVLFLTALTIGLFLLAMLAFRPRAVLPHVRPGLRATAVTAGVAGALLAYPLWWQFFGPMAYRGLPTFVLGYGADLAAYPAYASESLVGPSRGMHHLVPNATEQNAFFGVPLLVLLAVIIAWQWRASVAVRALTVTGSVLALLSLGREVTIGGRPTGVPGPWRLLADAPLFDSVVPTRLALFVVPVVALLLALGVDHALAAGWPRLGTGARRAVRLGCVAAAVAALVPIAPTPIDVARNQPTPRFFTSGEWRRHLATGATVLPVPLDWNENVDVMQWQLASGIGFVTPGGYYLAPPDGRTGRRARFGPEPTRTVDLLNRVAKSGTPPQERDLVTPDQAVLDLRKWEVDAVVMPDGTRHADVLRTVLEQVMGPGRRVTDVWLWDVRALTGR